MIDIINRIYTRRIPLLFIGLVIGFALASCAVSATAPPSTDDKAAETKIASNGSATPAANTPTIADTILPTNTPQPIITVLRGQTSAACQLPAIAVPTLPATIPGPDELDPATGLHMTGQYQVINLDSYRLQVTGAVDHPLSLTYDELRCMPKIQVHCTLICWGVFEDVATWAGTPFASVLDLAEVHANATQIRLVSADGYSLLLPIEAVRASENFLAYEWESKPLPILHGFPVRAVFPSMSGSDWLKWLVQIEVR